MELTVEILVTEGCPHAGQAVERTERVLEALAPGASLTIRAVQDRDEALALAFPGSPTIRVNGMDLEGVNAGSPALACRRYGTEGCPPTWMIEAAVLRALAPQHILFLCVANSARSQMAEGIARTLAGKRVKISSAGSKPTQIRPEAIRVLEEIGIDAGAAYAKGLEAIQERVDAVITLCAEEVCPVWLGKAWRLHWGLPDPAGVTGNLEVRLEAFRNVRDELRRRLSALFEPGAPS